MRLRGVLAMGIALVSGAAMAAAPAKLHPSVAVDLGRAETLYTERCASCHGAELEGKAGPPLNMPSVTKAKPADLARKIQTTMPVTAPGSLTPADAASLAAYLRQQNGVK